MILNRYPPHSQNDSGHGNRIFGSSGIQKPMPLISEIDDETLFQLELSRLLYGSDPVLDQIIDEQLMLRQLKEEVAEFPFITPPEEEVFGPINIGNCLETGAPVGIFPRDVHFLAIGRSGCGKSTLFRNLIRQHVKNKTAVLIIDFENEYSSALDDENIQTFGTEEIKWNPLEVPRGMNPILYR